MVKRRSPKINTYPYVLYINCRKRQTIVKITITPLNTLRDITQRVFFMENRGRVRTAGKGLRRKFKMPHTRLLLPERLKGFIITV